MSTALAAATPQAPIVIAAADEPPRNTYIGGSMIAEILGLSSWHQPWTAYKKLRGEWRPDSEESRVMLRGKMMEPVIVELFKFDNPGWQVQYPAPFIRHPVHPFIGGHPDAYAIRPDGKRVGLELKSVNERNRFQWGPSYSDEAPPYYLAQCLWYLAIDSTVDEWLLTGLLGSDDLRTYPVRREPAMVEWILTKAIEFFDMAQRGEEPAFDATHSAAIDDLASVFFKIEDAEVVVADESMRAWRKVMEESAELASTYEKAKDTAKAHLLRTMGNAAYIDFGDKHFRRKQVHRDEYTVAPTDYVQASLVNPPKPKGSKKDKVEELPA